MKLRHWINIVIIGLAACSLTYLALHWAITSYVEPTCGRYAESHGMTYIKYEPLDPTIKASHLVNEGNCQLRALDGAAKTVSLVKASGTSYGAPLLVALALNWHFVFGGSLIGVALILATIIRVVTGKQAS